MDTYSYSAVTRTLPAVLRIEVVMSRVAVLLLVVLVGWRSPSNADVIRATAARQHPVVSATTRDVTASREQPKQKVAVAPSGAGDDGDRNSDGDVSIDDDDDAAVRRQGVSDGEYRADLDASKRKWRKPSLQVWGKRRWSATNSKAAWGKRADEFDEDEAIDRNWRPEDPTAWNEQRHELEEAGKRGWSANNGMRAWGKRSMDVRSKRSVSGGEVALPSNFVDYGQQQRRAPVKRQYRKTADGGGPKRTWEFNTMKTWGKRRANWLDDVERLDGRQAPKRSWSSDNSLRIWGKRGRSGHWNNRGIDLP